ncbi:MAG: hypothetical protein A4S09_04005 [Proteobacteria bacterium SG_bin7]|nr:MAG: hypothetical protein A4S09_04005 [Proteobacteria bacterium SG_bin7]
MEFKGAVWREVKEVISRLEKAGFTAWLAGGCVRDSLMQRVPKDFDIVTNAKPNEIEKLFPKALEVGKKFGIIILPFDGYQIEIATFRRDGEYKDGRHPKSVTFASPKEDAMRRDFTINALFYDPQKGEVVDHVRGLEDIKQKIIRTVGDPEKRYEEDKLRILRGFRFCSQLSFGLEEKTFLFAGKFSLSAVSNERIRDEVLKLLGGENRIIGLSLLEQSGILASIVPEIIETLYMRVSEANLNPWQLTKFLLTKNKDSREEMNLIYFFVPFIKALGLERLDQFTDRFRLSRENANILDFVGRHWLRFSDMNQKRNSFLLTTFNHKYGEYLFEFLENLESIVATGDWKKTSNAVRAVLPPHGKLPAPLVLAQDLMNLGFAGAALGEAIKKSYAWQLDGEVKSKAEILKRLKK